MNFKLIRSSARTGVSPLMIPLCSLGLFIPAVSLGSTSSLAVSSAQASAGSVVNLTISLSSAYLGQDEGLQWTLNVPPEVTSVVTVAGDAANAAGKTLYCANQICLLTGMNTTPIGNGAVAVISLTLSSSASGNLPIQLSNPVEALADGTGGAISATSGVVSITPPGSIGVGVAPLTAGLTIAQTQQFTANVTGTTNAAVTWTRNPAVGTLSASGLYTAPSPISAAQTVTITATSTADSTKSASATINLFPPVSVSIAPAAVSLSTSQSQQFSAGVTGATNTGVTWVLGSTVGTLSASGVYTAPSTISASQNLTVTAISLADSTKFASATVSLLPPASVAVSPTAASLSSSQTQQFTASVTGTTNTLVTWTMSPAVGYLSTGGLYTAPKRINSPQTITITATLNSDPTKSATSTISLGPSLSVAISPASVSLSGLQSQQFTATVTGTTNTAVSWTMNPAVGSLSTSGLYTAPSGITANQTVAITATSAADSTKFATATVTLLADGSVTVTPGSVTLANSQSQQFTVFVTGGANAAVTWSIVIPSGSTFPSTVYGTLSTSGLYKAPPSIGKNMTVTIQATNTADPTKWGTALIRLSPKGK